MTQTLLLRGTSYTCPGSGCTNVTAPSTVPVISAVKSSSATLTPPEIDPLPDADNTTSSRVASSDPRTGTEPTAPVMFAVTSSSVCARLPAIPTLPDAVTVTESSVIEAA